MASDAPSPVEWHLRHRATERSFVRQAAAVVDLLPSGPILDLGCGTAPFTEFLDPERNPWCGLERDQVMAAGTLRRPAAKPGRVTVADGAAVPFPPGHFAAVVALGLFEYLARPADVLKEAARVTRPGGIVALTVPRQRSPYRLGLAAVAPLLRVAGRADPFDLDSGRAITPADAREWGKSAGLELAVARPVAPALVPWPFDRFLPAAVPGRRGCFSRVLGTAWLFVFACPAGRLVSHDPARTGPGD